MMEIVFPRSTMEGIRTVERRQLVVQNCYMF